VTVTSTSNSIEVKLNEALSTRIWAVRYFMVLGIIVLHLPPLVPLIDSGNSVFDLFRAFLVHGVFRATVPLLTVISGFLLFQSTLPSQPLRLLQKKTRTLLLPLILWNLPFAILIYMTQRYNLGVHDFSRQLYPFSLSSWIDVFTGLRSLPGNYPLNFLRDLFAVSLLAPVFLLLYKKAPYIGFILVFAVFFYNLDGEFVLRNNMMLTFYFGGLAATKKWDLTVLDKYAKGLLLVFILFCAQSVFHDNSSREFLRVLSPLLIWPAFSLVRGSSFEAGLRRYSGSSFFTFLAHAPIILILSILFHKILPDAPYVIYWFAAPPITILLSIWGDRLLKRLFPQLARLSLGGR
jgi:succinoglycan biosynthesis protein ExoH